MDAGEVLKSAWASVQSAGLPPELHEAALAHAVSILREQHTPPPAGPTQSARPAEHRKPDKPAPPRQSPKSDTSIHTESSDGGDASPDEETFFANINRETGVKIEHLEDILTYSPTDPTVNVTGRQLGTKQKQKQIAITLFIGIARQYGLGEKATSTNIIRAECERFKCADRNLTTVMRSIKGVRFTGEGRIRDVQIRDAAFEEFSALVLASLNINQDGI